jgi:adenylyl cyclase-associated protein
LQQPDAAGLQTVVQPLADSLTKAHALTEGRKTAAFNCCKAVAESLSALTWVCYTGKDCGKQTYHTLLLLSFLLL